MNSREAAAVTVEHLHSRDEAEAFDKRLGFFLHVSCDLAKITRHPCGPHCLLQLEQIRTHCLRIYRIVFRNLEITKELARHEPSLGQLSFLRYATPRA